MKKAGTSIIRLTAACLLLLLALQNVTAWMTSNTDPFENEIEQVSGAEKSIESYNSQSISEYISHPFTDSRASVFTRKVFLRLKIGLFIPSWAPSIYLPPPEENCC